MRKWKERAEIRRRETSSDSSSPKYRQAFFGIRHAFDGHAFLDIRCFLISHAFWGGMLLKSHGPSHASEVLSHEGAHI